MVVTTPTVTVTNVTRNAGTITSQSDPMQNTWGAYYDITNPTGVHSAILILHAPDDGSSGWDTDTYVITFTLNAASQTKGDTMYSKLFNSHAIPTAEATWSSDTVTVTFDSGDLDGDSDNVQSISFVALLDGSEWEGVAGNDIVGFKVFMIDAMPTVTTASEPASFAFLDDEFTFDSGDAGETVSVTMAHTDLPASGDYAELYDDGATPSLVTTYTNNPFTTTLTDGYFLKLYIDMPYDDNATDIAVRRINMTQN